MPPRLHFIRHAAGHHNLSQENQNIRDPLLTAHGEVQCAELAREIGEARMKSIDYIVASPLQRTLNTALCIFQKLLKEKPGLKIIALPELQETSLLPCDVGSPIEQLLDLYKDKPVDFSFVGENWIEKTTGPFSPHSRHLSERCKKARHFLRQQDKAEIAVVTHGALLHYLTEDWYQAMVGCGWSNCELRTYHFDTSTEESNANASIVEVYSNLVLRGPRSTLPSSEE
ncbi:phosphoglycerate mutase-like protein [Corynespora cassiicola Philippines]|uniref:Phosphoglycerate mutase-like protein n=1 Tax=Corynespora cassiicola Philippines TaxID=1448308 RepID=A0A2T2P7I0_CORCC|nr:phosphoglycerate mutase-like protein [Corynespora cassiicola Philippines]